MTDIQTSEEETGKVEQDMSKPAEQSPAAPVIDYEKKFQESSRENQLLRDAQAKRDQAEQELTKEPTESDLRTAFPEWDGLSDFEKKMARGNLAAMKLAAASTRKADELASDRAWNTSIEIAVTSDQALQGKEQAFRQFASQPKYKGTDMDLLISAFLQKNPSAPARPATPKPGLETGNGGPRTPDKPKLLSSTELQMLRKTDEKAYLAYVRKNGNATSEME
jgi:hypothetical protein